MRRSLATLGGIALGLAAHCDLAVAQAGGGSGGFGGGGGGGGGGGFGGGASGSSSDGGSVIGFFVVVGLFAVIAIVTAVAAWRRKRKVAARVARVRTASAEAAADDAYLAADLVEADAARLWLEVQAAWDARDREALDRLVGRDLMVEWRRRLDDFDTKGWHNRVRPTGEPGVQYVGLVNREGDADDRVTVLIDTEISSYAETASGQKILKDGASSEVVSVAEYWTLGRRDGGWFVLSIEQTAEGDHHLDDDIVALPEADSERLRGQAVTELAAADAVPEGFTTADLASVEFAGDARTHALDLSVADGRFAPDVMEVAARRAVAGWAEAVDGDDAALRAVSSPDAVRALLYAGDASGRTRVVVRGPRVRRITIAQVHVESEPAWMGVAVEVHATRYVEDRDTTDVLSGSKASPSTFTERWTLSLSGPPEWPWLLVAVA